MNTPTSAIFDLLDAAQHGPALTTILTVATGGELQAAADRDLITVVHRTGAVVGMVWATTRASHLQQRDDLTVHITAAGRDYLGNA